MTKVFEKRKIRTDAPMKVYEIAYHGVVVGQICRSFSSKAQWRGFDNDGVFIGAAPGKFAAIDLLIDNHKGARHEVV